MLREEVLREWEELKNRFFQLSDFQRIVTERILLPRLIKPSEIKDLKVISMTYQKGDGVIIEEID